MEKNSNINNSAMNSNKVRLIYLICDYIIYKTREINKTKKDNERIRMTGKRLQRIVYFSYVNYMIKTSGNKTMFKDEWYAWDSGPVIPDIYFAYDKYENGELAPLKNNQKKCILSADIQITIDEILELTSSIKDVEILNNEARIIGGPWEQSYESEDPYHDQVISDSSIYEFYKEKIPKHVKSKKMYKNN